MDKIDPKPGEIWLRRDGGKARIYATNCSDTYPIHGATESDGQWFVNVWTANGSYSASERNAAYDLIRRYDWREELKPIWAVLKPEYRWMAMDTCGIWYVYSSKPRIEPDKYYWEADLEYEGTHELSMPTPNCPWYETLTERPE
jgi:hypothetical protein